MAGSAFKNADVIKALSGFTPILVDGDTEKDVTKKYGVSGFPNTLFADAKGEAAGPAIVGAVPVEQFLQKAQDYAKKIKQGKPSKDFATLTAAKTDLDNARAKKKTAEALAAKKEILEDGQKRLDAARTAAAGDGKDAALKDLRKLAAEYKGTDVGAEAAKLLKELTPAPEPGAK